MKTTKNLTILLFCFWSSSSIAQEKLDKIYFKNQTVTYGKVLEIGIDEISYQDEFDGQNEINKAVVHKTEIAKIYKIEFGNGKVKKYKSDKIENDPSFYDWQKKNALKFNIVTVINRHLDFYFERSIKPNRSYELGVGIAGIGAKADESYSEIDENGNQEINFLDANYGLSLRAGYKLKTGPDYYYNRMREGHLLKGAYFKPEIVLSYFNLNTESTHYQRGYPSDPVTMKTDVFSAAFILNFGHQWVFSNQFGIDVFLGFGYGLSNHPDKTMSHYAFMMPFDTSLAFSGGMSFCYLLK